MGKDEACEVCGGTESKLVDGYYYCVECGTQDATVRETIVELQVVDDRFVAGRRTKYAVRRKEGVEMSPEWYKWHTYNFMLAGLTEQLVALGAAPSLRLKVLWIWSRYVRMYQKKDDMSRFKMLSQLEGASSSSGSEREGEGHSERAARLATRNSRLRLDRVSQQVLVGILALALNHDRSPWQMSAVSRLVAWRLLPVAGARRFVPPDVLRGARARGVAGRARGTLQVCSELPQVMGRLGAMLELGPPRPPDVEALVAAQLRELRLPPGLGRLVRALLRLLPVPWEPPRRSEEAPRFPRYETLTLAYILVALKMCFGLDDDAEVRLSAAVDRINRSERRPRALTSDPAPTDRLFSFRAWAAHLRRRALLLSRQFAPLAWQRNMRATDDALVEHFGEFAAGPPDGDKGSKPALSDEVTMDLLRRIPARRRARARPLAELRRAAAAPAPAHALARELAPAALDEDFTRYDLEYAYRRLTLPGVGPLEGVADAGKVYRRSVGRHLRCADADPTIVYVKACENKNWARTKRPTVAHVVDEEIDPGRDAGSDPGRDAGSDPGRGRRDPEDETELETFEEEPEGSDIFDDDFFGFKIKEEKAEAPEPSEYVDDEMKDVNVFDEFGDELEGAGGGGGRGVFDSDEEGGPRYDARTFNRAETIKQIMIAAYKKYIGTESKIPIRFRTVLRPRNEKSGSKRENNDRPEAGTGKRERHDGKVAIGEVVSAYQSSLARDAMQQVAEEVRRFVDAAEGGPELEPAEPGEAGEDQPPAEPGEAGDDRPPAGPGEAGDDRPPPGPDEARDVEVIENDVGNDDDSFDEPAYDPVYKGDAKFDERTHDASQLFLKLRAGPAAPGPAAGDDASLLDDRRPADDASREEKKRRRFERDRRKTEWRRMKRNIDHLVDEPGSISEFNYWFKHYDQCKTWKNLAVQVEIDSSFPRSFRFVMRECAAALGVAPGALYRRLADVERQLLSLLWRPAAAAAAKPSRHIRRGSMISITSDDSDSVVSSEESENEGGTKENIIPTDEPGPVPRRRSARIREKGAPDSFRR